MTYRYLHIGRAADLAGSDRVVYRFFEILPGALAWLTIGGVVIFSALRPVWVAIFIIAFDLYWFLKTVFLSVHLRINWKRLKENLKIDWQKKLEEEFPNAWHTLWHFVILPVYDESIVVIEDSLRAILKSSWDSRKIILVLALEGRGEDASSVGYAIADKYKDFFGQFLVTIHPAGVPGELPGKGSNETYAARKAKEFIDSQHISYENIIVSSFDVDTQVYPQYFSCVAYNFLKSENPHAHSYQPVPVYNNNIWEAPALSRVVASSGTFWQMMQQERPERLTTFSSHSMSFKTLVELDFWQTNIVSEDSRIFWNGFLNYDGRYSAIPLHYAVSMDANVAPTFWKTAKNVYRQQRRWAWGVENVPYMLFGFIKNKKISFRKKLFFTYVLVEGAWSWSTNALLIFLLGWLPLLIGGEEFSRAVLSYNLPAMTRTIMTLAMLGLVVSAIISTSLLPPKPAHYGFFKRLSMVAQWVLVPVTVIVFGSVPALEAQTRLMLGSRARLGFWTTPKHRKN